jgi:hypothetical protein
MKNNKMTNGSILLTIDDPQLHLNAAQHESLTDLCRCALDHSPERVVGIQVQIGDANPRFADEHVYVGHVVIHYAEGEWYSKATVISGLRYEALCGSFQGLVAAWVL